MALPKSNIRIGRKKISGMEMVWTKMWDPPRESPATPDFVGNLNPASTYYNPVPAFMAANVPGYNNSASHIIERTLLGGITLPTWDGLKSLSFMGFEDPDGSLGPVWPGSTIRIPRGKVLHCDSQGKGPPPHTIHWHGIEPTPMNDGVGHCSMEIGQYTYQMQPNFIGTYFYHCHRNTVQHFEFGLYGMLLVEPPDAYDPDIPINVRLGDTQQKNVGGYPRRTAANLDNFSQFSDTFVAGDPTFGVGNAADDDVGHPHDFTVAYHQEALWVFDDRDSNWSDLASHAKSFYPGGAATEDGPGGELIPPVPVNQPGVDDQFPKGFFHDYNADYWFVTGVPIPAPRGGSAAISPGNIIPAELNGGVSGMRVDVNAAVGDTVLVRVLNAAYNSIRVTFPVDVVIIAYDGRALGVPPFGRYNHAFELKAGTPHFLSTARRFDALIKNNNPFSGEATVEFYDSRGGQGINDGDTPLVTGRIPIVIS